MQVIRRGDSGPAVVDIRGKLSLLGLLPAGASETFDADLDTAVRAFQQARGLRIDGVIGPETYRAMDEAHWRLGDRVLSHVVGHPYVGDDVAALQQRLLELGFDAGRCDGMFGTKTETALREFQRNVGLPADGTVGPATLTAMDRLRKTVRGGSASARREEERLHRANGATGRVVVLDPGHGGDDLGAWAHELSEAEVVLDLARRVEGRLGALGVSTYLTRGADVCPTDAERARFANDAGADVLVSLHTDAAPGSESATGVATYYYGASLRDRVARSAVGEHLASLLQREIVARTDLVDCRTHPKTWELLRMTRMPAVRVDVGYVTNRGDAARLATPDFRDTLAEAVAAAIQRLYLPDDDAVVTGQFRLAALPG